MKLNESCEKLLKQIYDYEQKEAKPFQFKSNHSDYDAYLVHNIIPFLKDKGYIIVKGLLLSAYSLSLTAQGEQYVEDNL